MIEFKRKNFSNIVSSAVKGAGIGATVGSIAGGGLTPKSIPTFLPGSKKYNDLRKDKDVSFNDGKIKQQLTILGASVLVGAALGALVGIAKDADQAISRRTADKRLMGEVIKDLNKKAWKEGTHFTRDPKAANEMRTKVCLVITRDGANLKVLINTADDQRLKTAADKVVKGLSGPTQVRTSSASNRYNEITISTISNTPSNIKTVSELASGFIKAGYPVYLVEVG